MQRIVQSEGTAARRRIPFVLVDATDGFTAETGITFSAGEIKVSKAGGAEANHAGTVTELGGGLYYYEPTTGEVNTEGFLSVRFDKAGCRTFYAVVVVEGVNLNAAVADAVWDEILTGSTHNIANSAGRRLRTGIPTTDSSLRTGTAQAGAAGSITLDAGASGSDDFYNYTFVSITGGTGEGQARLITDYVGATKVASVDVAWVTPPDATSTFDITALGVVRVASMSDDSVTAAALAASAVAEIQSGLGTSANQATLAALIADVQSRLPAALVSGRMDSTVQASSSAARTEFADSLILRDLAAVNVTGVAKTAVYTALAKGALRVKYNAATGNIEIYHADNSLHATQAATANPSATPISEVAESA